MNPTARSAMWPAKTVAIYLILDNVAAVHQRAWGHIETIGNPRELIKSPLGRQKLRAMSKMPFSKTRGLVPGCFEHFTEGGLFQRQSLVPFGTAKRPSAGQLARRSGP